MKESLQRDLVTCNVSAIALTAASIDRQNRSNARQSALVRKGFGRNIQGWEFRSVVGLTERGHDQ